MKTAAKMLYILYVLCTLGTLGVAQAKPVDQTPAAATKPAKLTTPERTPVPDSAKEALRIAIHQHDQAQKQISDINLQFLQVQSQAKTQMEAAQKKEQESQAAITRAEDEAYKAAGLDRAGYAIDDETMQFSAKAMPPAKAAPAPPAPARQ